MSFTTRRESPFVQLTVSVEFWSWGMTGPALPHWDSGVCVTRDCVLPLLCASDDEDRRRRGFGWALSVTKCPLSSSSCLGMKGGQVEQDLT